MRRVLSELWRGVIDALTDLLAFIVRLGGWVLSVLTAVAVGAGMALLPVVIGIVFQGFAVMLLWNWLLPDLLSLPIIDFNKALGLTLLCRFLFTNAITLTSTTSVKDKRD